MLRKRKEPRAKKSVAETLLRDMQGTAAEKLALFEKLKARGGFDGEDRVELLKVERMLRTFAAKSTVSGRSRPATSMACPGPVPSLALVLEPSRCETLRQLTGGADSIVSDPNQTIARFDEGGCCSADEKIEFMPFVQDVVSWH